MSFRRYLNNIIDSVDINEFYIDLDNIDIEMVRSSDKLKRLGIVSIEEAIITPELIRIKSLITDIGSLNKEFSKIDIIFVEGEYLNAIFNQETNIIEIRVSKDSTKKEVEAIIGHELVHREQNRRSNGNFFKQAKVLQTEINDIVIKINTLNDGDERNLLINKHQVSLDTFTKNSKFEQMAYAYQMVREYDFTPSKLINILKYNGFTITNTLKKYIGMYYLIKDNIK